MSATCIGTTTAGPFFGMPSTNDAFISIEISARNQQETNELITFNGNCVKSFSNPSLLFSISGFTSNVGTGNIFSNIFSTSSFASDKPYFLDLANNYNGWLLFFEKTIVRIFYEAENETTKFLNWEYKASAEEVREVFISKGFTSAIVTKLGEGLWAVSGVPDNFKPFPEIQNYPISTEVSENMGAISIMATKRSVLIKITEISESLVNDDFMRFELLGTWNEEAFGIADKNLQDKKIRPSPIEYL